MATWKYCPEVDGITNSLLKSAFAAFKAEIKLMPVNSSIFQPNFLNDWKISSKGVSKARMQE
jgi:hypothetical protein